MKKRITTAVSIILCMTLAIQSVHYVPAFGSTKIQKENAVTALNGAVSENDISENEISENEIVEEEEESLTGSDSELPVSYNSADYGWVTEPKKQKGGTCMAYATTSCFETSLIMQGYEDNTVDLSERYLVKCVDYEMLSAFYLSKGVCGRGITYESNMPTDGWDGDNDKNMDSSIVRDEKYRVSEVKKVVSIATHRLLTEDDIIATKKAIMKYGSVRMAYTLGSSSYDSVGHAIQLTGWNDNYYNSSAGRYEGVWYTKNSSPCNLGRMKYNGYNVRKIEAFKVIPKTNTIDYNMVTDSKYNKKYVYDFSTSDTLNRQIVNTLGLQWSSGKEEILQAYKNPIDENEPATGTPLFDNPISISSQLAGYSEITIPQITLQKNDKLYFVTNSYGLYGIRALAEETNTPCTNIISVNSVSINVDGISDSRIDASVIYPAGDSTIRYTSLDTNVATVNSTGLVHGITSGETYIMMETDSDRKYVKVTSKIDLSKAQVKISDVYYNALRQEPEPVVTLNGVTLIKGTHYEYTDNDYTDNMYTGTASLTIHGKGLYANGNEKQSAKGTFQILKPSVENIDVNYTTLTYNYYNSYITTDGIRGNDVCSATIGGHTFWPSESDIKAELDVNRVGKRTLIITGINNFVGTKKVEVTVVAKPLDTLWVDLGDNYDLRVYSTTNGEYNYTGKEVKPEIVVSARIEKEIISISADEYTVTYSNNIEPYRKNTESSKNKPAPRATVTLTGNYSGTGYVEFDILKSAFYDPSSKPVISDVVWTDGNFEKEYSPKGQTFEPTLTMPNGTVLIEGEDYILNVLHPEDIKYFTGATPIEAVGIGNYGGTSCKYYNIIPRDIDDIVMEFKDTMATGKDVYPEKHFFVDDMELSEFGNPNDNYFRLSQDHKLEYSNNFVIEYFNNTAPGEATVIVTAKSGRCFVGSRTEHFTISASEITPTNPTPAPGEDKEDENDDENDDEPTSDTEEAVVLIKGEKITYPYTADSRIVNSNKKIVTASVKNGVLSLKALKGGTSLLTITDLKGNITRLTVTVEQPVQFAKTVEVVKDSAGMVILNGTTQDITWSTKNPSVAVVSEDGTVTGMKKGSTNIYGKVHGINYKFTVKVVVPVLSKSNAYVKANNTLKLSVKNTKLPVTYSVEDASIAVISDKGVVTGKALGKTKAKAEVGGTTLYCDIEIIPSDKPKLEASTVYIAKGLTGTVGMVNKDMQPVWTSSNPNIVSVLENGTITAISKGKAKVTGVLYGKSYTVTITVEEPYLSVTDISLKTPESNNGKNDSFTLKLKNTKQKVTWRSSDPETASVAKGKIAALRAGKTIITATTTDGAAYECTVTVE